MDLSEQKICQRNKMKQKKNESINKNALYQSAFPVTGNTK